eukprot:569887-Amphidinium_carterae.1
MAVHVCSLPTIHEQAKVLWVMQCTSPVHHTDRSNDKQSSPFWTYQNAKHPTTWETAYRDRRCARCPP